MTVTDPAAGPTRQGAASSATSAVVGTVVAAFALSWSAWGAALALHGTAWAAVLQVAGTFGPLTAVLITVGRVDGRAGVAESLRRHVRWQGTGRSTVWAVTLPPSLIGAALVVDTVLGGVWSVQWPPLLAWPVVLAYVLVLGGPLGEELAWRGHLLPRLADRCGPMAATVIVGTVWALWHLPLFLMAGTVQRQLPVWLFVWQIVATSFVYTWLQHRNPSSLVPALVLHTSFNTAVGVGLIGPDGPNVRAMVIALVMATVLAAALMATPALRQPH